jgi:hypothetical protein
VRPAVQWVNVDTIPRADAQGGPVPGAASNPDRSEIDRRPDGVRPSRCVVRGPPARLLLRLPGGPLPAFEFEEHIVGVSMALLRGIVDALEVGLVSSCSR